MKMNSNEIVWDLLMTIAKQEKEIAKLQRTIDRINQYIKVYEDYIKGERK